MARTGVTYTSIAKAAEAIKARGEEPTVDRVRELLGTGSKSTIAPLLKRWRAEIGESADVSGLPADLVEVMKTLHERVQQIADQKIRQAQAEFQSINGDLRKELAGACQTVEQLTSHQNVLDLQIKTMKEDQYLLSQSLDESRAAATKYELQRDYAIDRVTELKAAVTELKLENRDIRDHFEHYQQRIAEDRQIEREQFHLTRQQLQNQVQSLSEQLTSAKAEIIEQSKNCSLQQMAINEITVENHSLVQEVDRSNEAVEVLKRNLESSHAKEKELLREIEQFREKISSMESLKASADKEVSLLTQMLTKAELEWQECKEKVVLLTNENKAILEEKAIMQGKLLQLQSS
jgi:chromosome segregation ATPase